MRNFKWFTVTFIVLFTGAIGALKFDEWHTEHRLEQACKDGYLCRKCKQYELWHLFDDHHAIRYACEHCNK